MDSISINQQETMEVEATDVTPVRVYKYRWVILLTFCLYSAVNFMQFLQYTIISDITAKYYGVENILVDLSGLTFMICFVVFCLPCNFIVEKYNLRVTAIVTSGLTTCGSLVKLLSVSPDRYYVVMIGQFLSAVGQVAMLSIPSKLASTWFGSEEVSTACAFAIFGTQIGVALGSIFSSHVVKNSDDVDSIGHDFMTLHIINSSISVAAFVLTIFIFRAKPPLPPSQSQVNIDEKKQVSTLDIIKSMLKNKNYLLLVVAVGSSNGMYTCFGIIISSVYLHYFPGYEAEIGIIAALAVVAGGCIGSVVFGYLLDKYHHFKMTTFLIIFASAIMYIFVVLSLELKSQLATYFTIPIFGFFIASTLLVGFEFTTEIMYPMPEAACCGILNSCIYIFTIVYDLMANALLDNVGYIPAHIVVFILLLLSSLVIYFMSPTLKRRQANIGG